MTRKLLKIALVVLLSVVSISIDAQEKPVLWYDKPARYWEEALPLGNGRLGAMVYGNPVTEEIQLNYKPQNKMFHFCKTFCSKITLVNTIQNVI